MIRIVQKGMESTRSAAYRAADEATQCHEIVRQLPCRQTSPSVCKHQVAGECSGPNKDPGLGQMGLRQLLVTILAISIGIWMYFASDLNAETRNHGSTIRNDLGSDRDIAGR